MSRFSPGALKRRLYAHGRPRGLMRWWNRLDAALYSRGWCVPRHAAVLLLPGRRSGRTHRVPLALVDLGGFEYVVSMLGPRAGWVRNVKAVNGRAMLRQRGRDRAVRLELVPAEERAVVLRRYLAIAPGARAHVRVHHDAPLHEFQQIAPAHPVFRVHRT